MAGSTEPSVKKFVSVYTTQLIGPFCTNYEVCSVKNDNASVAQMRDTREKIR